MLNTDLVEFYFEKVSKIEEKVNDHESDISVIGERMENISEQISELKENVNEGFNRINDIVTDNIETVRSIKEEDKINKSKRDFIIKIIAFIALPTIGALLGKFGETVFSLMGRFF